MTDTKTAPGAWPTLTLLADLPNQYGTHLAFHPDGQRWALADSRAIQLGHEGTLDQRITAPESIHHLAFARDGQRLLACPQVYDLEQSAWATLPGLGKALMAGLDDPPAPDQLGLAAGACAADGQDLAVVTRFQPSRGLGAIDTYGGPKERLLVIGPDRALRGVLHAGDEELRAVAVSDTYVAAGGATVLLWERASLRQRAALAHHRVVARALAFAPGADRLAAAAADGEVSLWNTASATLLASWKGHQGDAYAVAFHPRLPLLATGGMDGMLRLWSVTGELVHEVSLGGWVQAVAFAATGTRLAAVTRARPPRLVIYALSAPTP